MSREIWIREKQMEADRLEGIATNAIVPSRRDFSQFIASQRTDLALVARLKRRDPQTPGSWPALDVTALAAELDDSDVAALAIATATLHGMSADDLEALPTALSVPLLRDDLCIDEVQIYDSRLRGADAVRIPVAELPVEQMEKLCDIAVSLHVTPVLDLCSGDDLARAPIRAPYCVGLSCAADDGFVDITVVRAIAARIPRNIVVLALAEPRSVHEALDLRGVVDGVVVGDVLLNADSPMSEIDRFLAS